MKKKIVFTLVLLLFTAPALASTVTIDANQIPDTNQVEISYTSDGNLPRGFGLDITVTDGNIVACIPAMTVGECTTDDRGFGIFPSTILIDDAPPTPVILDVGTPVSNVQPALGGLDTNGITIELGSLYQEPNAPPSSGVLCTIVITKSCIVRIAGNAGRCGESSPALGVVMMILSLILLALGSAIPKLPPEFSALLLETGVENIAAMVEELGVRSKGIYLPSSLNSGRPQALIPLHANPTSFPTIEALPHRLIVRYGANPDDIGLLLTTPGTVAVSMLDSTPAPTATELESALTSLLTGKLGIADGTKIFYNENHIRAEISNPSIENKTSWFHQCLGGPLASIVASVVAEAWNRPVTIKQEEQNRKHCSIDLEVLG